MARCSRRPRSSTGRRIFAKTIVAVGTGAPSEPFWLLVETDKGSGEYLWEDLGVWIDAATWGD